MYNVYQLELNKILFKSLKLFSWNENAQFPSKSFYNVSYTLINCYDKYKTSARKKLIAKINFLEDVFDVRKVHKF